MTGCEGDGGSKRRFDVRLEVRGGGVKLHRRQGIEAREELVCQGRRGSMC